MSYGTPIGMTHALVIQGGANPQDLHVIPAHSFEEAVKELRQQMDSQRNLHGQDVKTLSYEELCRVSYYNVCIVALTAPSF